MRRVGDFFVEAPTGAHIAAWPLVTVDEHRQARELRRRLLEDMAEEANEEASKADPGPGPEIVLVVRTADLVFGWAVGKPR